MTDTQEARDTKRGVGPAVGVLGLVVVLVVGAVAFGSSAPVAASGLERFASCADLRSFTGSAGPRAFGRMAEVGAAVAEDRALARTDGDGGAPAPALSPVSGEAGSAGAGASTAGSDDGTGGTNTVVAGVDEIDVIDRVSDDLLLVSRQGHLALVDLRRRAVVAEVGAVPHDARVSVAGNLVWAAGSSEDGTSTVVRRFRIDGTALVDDGRWETPGWLLDARRTGDRLYVIAVDHPQPGAIPFAGGPVACDQVWRPTAAPVTPGATLVASLPASGDLVPVAATEVVGTAGNLLVTDRSVYLATESWETEEPVTGLHRFAIDTLALTGSGSVPGTLAGPFALSEHDGTLRVATTAGGGVGFMGGRGIAIDGGGVGMAVDDGVAVSDGDEPVAVDGAPPPAAGVSDAAGGTRSGGTEEAGDPEAPADDQVEILPAPIDEPPGRPTPPEGLGGPRAEVFVLDTEGDLDLLGRTGLFGHDGESIHGVRFVGDTAYVVTFLQTDPFWVVDLADPAAPAVVGELEIPGFSGYLHPLGPGRVVGFGPDGEGLTSARLFDVSDPAAPAVLDEIPLGHDSPVIWDHKAFVTLDGTQFAVPVTEYPEYHVQGACGPDGGREPMPMPMPAEPEVGATRAESGTSGGGSDPAPDVPGGVAPCTMTPVGGGGGVVVLDHAGGRLAVAGRHMVETGDMPELYAERAVRGPDGAWHVLTWDRLVAVDTATSIVLPHL